MRKLLFVLLSLCVVIPMKSQISVITSKDLSEGKPCGKVKYLVTYDTEFVRDTAQHPYSRVKDQMLLEIGDEVSRFYSYGQFQADSVNREMLAKGEQRFTSKGVLQTNVYRNYPEKGKYFITDVAGSDRFACYEDVIFPEWEIEPDSSRVIIGYKCHKAKALFGGRTWYVWYSEDIPLDEGVWKLKGLPGLVLHAEDSEGQYFFTAVGLKQMKEDRDIMYRGDIFEVVKKDEMAKTIKRYHSDPVGYLTNGANVVSVKVTDDKGNPVSNFSVPYNPIER